MTAQTLLYMDYKSPYAYLAKQPAYDLEAEFGFEFDWRPYTLDIPNYLGSARLGDDGAVIEENRTPHQWRRVRYSYMDVRRYANREGLTIRGPRKIWDSSLAQIGMLYAQTQGRDRFRRYNDLVFERFWKRELDIKNADAVLAILEEAGCASAGFPGYSEGAGREEHARILAGAEEMGIFGVPTFVIGGELFWGREHLELVRGRLGGSG